MIIMITLIELMTLESLETNPNYLNPYDVLGELHNQGLDYAIDNMPTSPTRKDAATVTGEFMGTITGKDSLLDILPYKMVAAHAINNMGCCDKGLEGANLSVEQKGLIEKTYSFADGLDADMLGLYFIRLQNKILSSNLSEEERKLPLLGVAVGKASAQYWTDQVAAGVASPWHTIITAAGGPAAINKIVKGDIKGAGVGAVSGAVLSWWSGPGVVVGAAAGAVAGAIGGSITEAIYSLL